MRLALILLVVLLALPLAVQAGTLPMTAQVMAEDLDAQLAQRTGALETPVKGMTLMVTTPVDLSDLTRTSPVARLMAEEMMSWFVTSGYRVQELRKGRNILLKPGSGEHLLTRASHLLANDNVMSALILAGTYTVSKAGVRFNMRLIMTPTNEVVAMASQTLPLSEDMAELLPELDARRLSAVAPTVGASLMHAN